MIRTRRSTKRLYDLVKRNKTGIIYCSTRKKVEQVYEALSDLGLSVTAYHAGMTDAQREEAQNAFMNRQADIVIATNAFGMGIDRCRMSGLWPILRFPAVWKPFTRKPGGPDATAGRLL